jgi:hypothetical protein
MAQQQKADCKPGDLFTQAGMLKSSGDSTKDIQTLLKFADAIQAQNIACNGMVFTGSKGSVIGPLELPKGTYKVTVKTKGFFISKSKILNGECGGMFGLSFYIFEGSANDGEEKLFESQGCKMAIETSNVSASYTITIVPFG